jgi:type I restriction enzyme, S subunit
MYGCEEKFQVVPLSDICEKAINGGTPSTLVEKYWMGTIPWITGADIIGQKVNEIRRFITEEAVKNSSTNVIPKGSLLIVTRTGVGKLAIAPFNIAISQDITGFIPKEYVDVKYLFWILNKSMEYFQNFNQGTSINGITRKDLMNLKVPLPPLPEQQRIAEILNTVDEAIEKTESIIAQTEILKQGLTQELLQINWQLVNLGNERFFNLATGGTPSTKIPEYWNGDIPWLLSGEVHKKLIYNTEKRISNKGYENSNATLIPKRSILIALAGQGKTRGTVAITEIELTTNQSVAAIVPNEEYVFPYYIYHKLDTMYEELRAYSAGSGRAGLSLQLLREILIPLPPLPEQQKISEILSSVDEKIKSERKQLEQLKILKKGLMHDLLTGRVRVEVGANA